MLTFPLSGVSVETRQDCLHKKAYGGDLVGDGQSYYDWSPFYSLDETIKNADYLKDKRNYSRTVPDMLSYAKSIKAGDSFNIDDRPVTRVILSENRYNEGKNIDGLDWADRVEKAAEKNDTKALTQLARYGYSWYGTDRASEVPFVPTKKRKNKKKNTIGYKLVEFILGKDLLDSLPDA